MALGGVSRSVGSSLRTRVLLLVALVLAVVATPAWFAFQHIVDQATLNLGMVVAEKQVKYDRYRGLETLKSEIALAETMTRAPAIIAWAQDESDPERLERGLAEMEHYRKAFSEQSVFVVIDGSGRYYFNDAFDSYGAAPYRYSVRANNPRDGWYFATRERREGCFANVDHDDVLRVTKVWINCIISHEGQVLGIAGTGLDLSDFIREVVDLPEPGITSIFVDQSGAVQAHRDASLVDFHSLTKDIAERTTIFSMLESPADMAYLRSLMNAAFEDPDSVHTGQITLAGTPALIGVGFLDRIGWYNITIMDPDAIVDRSLFAPIGLLLVALLIAIAFILAWIFRVAVLDRLAQVEAGLSAIRDGRVARISPDRSNDEIGRLTRTLIEMVRTIGESRHSLENQVRERTEQLESLVNLDAMTGIFNRRGFTSAFLGLAARAEIEGSRNGVMLIDVDNFKTINDTEGHPAGDQVIIEVARRLGAAVRRADVCARWGGDEFIVLIKDCDGPGLRQVAAAIRELMGKVPVTLSDNRRIAITVSVGAALLEPTDSIDTATGMADAALYTAKQRGRDCVVMFDPESGEREAAAAQDPELRRPA